MVGDIIADSRATSPGIRIDVPEPPEGYDHAMLNQFLSDEPTQRIEVFARRFFADDKVIIGSPLFVALSDHEHAWERNLRRMFQSGTRVDPVSLVHESRRRALRRWAGPQSKTLEVLRPLIEWRGDHDFSAWAQKEFKGYQNGDTPPDFRRLEYGLARYNGNVWKRDQATLTEKGYLLSPIKVIDDAAAKFYSHPKADDGYIFPELVTSSHQKAARKSAIWLFRASDLLPIQDGVANRVLEWTNILIKELDDRAIKV